MRIFRALKSIFMYYKTNHGVCSIWCVQSKRNVSLLEITNRLRHFASVFEIYKKSGKKMCNQQTIVYSREEKYIVSFNGNQDRTNKNVGSRDVFSMFCLVVVVAVRLRNNNH